MFGILADTLGRKKIFVLTCALVIMGSIGSAAVQDLESWGIYSQLSFWRFILGVGVGGEYPLSASITSEGSQRESRTQNLCKVFSMQGLGSVFCSLVLVFSTQCIENESAQWRFPLAMGGLPMVNIASLNFSSSP